MMSDPSHCGASTQVGKREKKQQKTYSFIDGQVLVWIHSDKDAARVCVHFIPFEAVPRGGRVGSWGRGEAEKMQIASEEKQSDR